MRPRDQALTLIGVCAAHLTHRPRSLTIERHHTVPQAWQLRDGVTKLWAPSVTPLCPTGHANVHELIVAMMTHLRDARTDKPSDAWEAVRFGGKVERLVAYQGLVIYAESGRSLLELADAGQLGRGMVLRPE